MFKKKEFDEQLEEINKFINKYLFKTIIRGVDGIRSTFLNNKLFRSYINDEGAVVKKNINVVNTIGTNLNKMIHY